MAPRQKPRRSVQDVETPEDFIAAVVRRFGAITVDLAADQTNRKADIWLGPGSSLCEDALAPKTPSWDQLIPFLTVGWLNPRFGNIDPFARRAAEAGKHGARICMLVPASVGTAWWAEHVHRKAYVSLLRPRIKFVGHRTGFPKDLALACYNPPRLPSGRLAPEYHLWNWQTGAIW